MRFFMLMIVLAFPVLDVLVRLRSKCYCGEGSFVALLLWLAVGLVVLGPALLLVLWRRRRRGTGAEALDPRGI